MFMKYPSIENVKQVRKEIYKIYGLNSPKFELKGTVKVHGTNAGINITQDGIYAQSRNRELTLESDNAGFCNFVEANKELLKPLQRTTGVIRECITVYGEWCGGNIQKGVGVTDMPKSFIVFGMKITNGDYEEWIDHTVFKDLEIPNTYIIEDFGVYEYILDFNSSTFFEDLMNITLEVEKECPVAKQLNPEGNLVGEGVVWTFNTDNKFFKFKVKGDKHSRGSGSKTVKPSKVYTEEALKDIQDFFSVALSVDRLEQGKEYLVEMGLDDSPKNTGEYLKWINKDIIKECNVEISDLYTKHEVEWKDIQKDVTKTARNYFLGN